MTDPRLAELEALAAKATGGKWRWTQETHGLLAAANFIVTDDAKAYPRAICQVHQGFATTELIVRVHEAVKLAREYHDRLYPKNKRVWPDGSVSTWPPENPK